MHHGQDRLFLKRCRSGEKSRAQTVSRAFGPDSEAGEMEQVQETILQPSVLVLEEQTVSCPVTHNGCGLATERWLSHPVLPSKAMQQLAGGYPMLLLSLIIPHHGK